MSPDFNYNSMRSKKARLTVKISPIIRNMLKLIEISFFVIGIIMIVASEPIGWLLIGVAFIPLMILWWWNGELHRLGGAVVRHLRRRVHTGFAGDENDPAVVLRQHLRRLPLRHLWRAGHSANARLRAGNAVAQPVWFAGTDRQSISIQRGHYRGGA